MCEEFSPDNMAVIIQDRKTFTLLEVAQSIEKTLSARYTSSFWVKAEMNKLNHYSHSGHCYPELVEKQEGKVVAQMRANLWKDDYKVIDQKFRQVLREPLKDGIKILFLAKISFSPSYGLALTILDIDPAFTLGDLEKEKQETIIRLKEEKLFDQNRLRSLPLLPQRIALISVETSKGYADFTQILDNNPWQYKFFYMLFPSLLQGDGAVPAIMKQLERIRKVQHHFDVVAIIRGGGGDIGLSCFNHFELSKKVAGFPLPVLSGIGHATNETVVEMVAHSNLITPTETANFLIQKFHNFSVPVQEAESMIKKEILEILSEAQIHLGEMVGDFERSTRSLMKDQHLTLNGNVTNIQKHVQSGIKHQLHRIGESAESLSRAGVRFLRTSEEQVQSTASRIRREGQSKIKMEYNTLDHFGQQVENMSPERVLQRGYSITRLNGKVINSEQKVNKGDLVSTELFTQIIESKVEKTSKRKHDREN